MRICRTASAAVDSQANAVLQHQAGTAALYHINLVHKTLVVVLAGNNFQNPVARLNLQTDTPYAPGTESFCIWLVIVFQGDELRQWDVAHLAVYNFSQ